MQNRFMFIQVHLQVVAMQASLITDILQAEFQ